MIELLFRFLMYVFIGLSLEIIFSVIGIEFAVGAKIERRAPKKYLEGFVSLFMIPIHGLGVLFCFEPMYYLIANLHWGLRYCIWGICFVAAEALAGLILDKIFGFYPWDYYALSKFKVAKRGYSLWTLLPLWGLYGLALEIFVKILVYVSPLIKNVL